MGRVRAAALHVWLGGVHRWDRAWPPFDVHVLGEVGGRRVAHVGIVWREVGFGPERADVGLIGGVYTDPAVRGRGVASRLMQIADEEMARRSATHGVLICRDELRAFYEPLGWTAVEGSVVCDWGAGPEMVEDTTMFRVLDEGAMAPEGPIDLCGRPV